MSRREADRSETYGIPTISKLLVATKQLSTPEFASKRFVDTGVLISEFTANHPKDERTIKALARMNYIHRFVTNLSSYQTPGDETNAEQRLPKIRQDLPG